MKIEKCKLQTVPSFSSLDELVDFFDSHDMGEYEQSFPEVQFEVDLQERTHLMPIDEEITNKLGKLERQTDGRKLTT